MFQPQGVYALTTRTQTDAEKAALVALPFVDGMTAFVGWSEFEPTRGVYDFSRLDADIAIARAAGKRISIGVLNGKDAVPTWVNAAGIQTWVNSQGDTLIYPTDPTFTVVWTEAIRALGERYDNDPTVVQIGMCGTTATRCGPRYPELPAGITLDQLVTAWTPIVAAYLQAFPNTYLHIELNTSTNGFGTQLPETLFNQVPSGVAIGPFIESLSETNPLPTSPIGLAYPRVTQRFPWCAFQMVGPLGDNIDDAIALGRSYGCNYFEIYKSDLENQGALITAAMG